MNISVLVKAHVRQEKVERVGPAAYAVWVRAPAREGKANEAVRAALSDCLGVPKTRIVLVRGAASSHKVFEVRGC